MKFLLKNTLYTSLLLGMILITACSQEEKELILPEEDDSSVLLLPRSGNPSSDVFINLSDIDWSRSNVYRAQYNNRIIAEICKEYLYQKDTIDRQAIVVYPIDSDGKADLTQGHVAQIIDLTTGRPDTYLIHNGRVSFHRQGDSTVCHYLPGTESPKTIVYIGGNTRSLSAFEEATLAPYLIYDADKNSYGTVKIGCQYWQRENLQTTRYLNNDTINQGCWDNGIYGRLYSWDATNQKSFILGYHLPSHEEWLHLRNYLGGNSQSGVKIKSSSGWVASFFKGNNITGFNALPAGYYDPERGIQEQTGVSYWWCTSSTSSQQSWYLKYLLNPWDFSGFQGGASIRCIRNE